MLVNAYCSLAEANEYNNSNAWNVLTDDEREVALSWGRVYLDSKYRVHTYFDKDAPPDEVKLGNALLGAYYAAGQLYEVSSTGNLVVESSMVQAGSVKVQKKFATGASLLDIDKFPDVTSVVSPYLSLISASISQATLIRQ